MVVGELEFIGPRVHRGLVKAQGEKTDHVRSKCHHLHLCLKHVAGTSETKRRLTKAGAVGFPLLIFLARGPKVVLLWFPVQ